MSRPVAHAAWSAHLLWEQPEESAVQTGFPQDRRDRSPPNQVLSLWLIQVVAGSTRLSDAATAVDIPGSSGGD